MGVRLQAFADLFGRYRQVWKAAWKHRHKMEPPRRLPHEVQFLPAALSLQDTPVSPLPRQAMRLIMAFALLTLLWAVFGRMDVVATASGKIVANERTKTIQPLESAPVKAIHVTDGMHVKAGDLLIELDATAARADHDRYQAELAAARLQVARAQTLLRGMEAGFTADIDLPRPKGVTQTQYSEAQNQLAGQIAELAARISRIRVEVERRQAEAQATRQLILRLQRTVPIAQERAATMKKLFDMGAATRYEYLTEERNRLEQEGELDVQRSRLDELNSAVREALSQQDEALAEARRTALDNLNDGQQKTASLEQELIKAQTRNALTRLHSPVDGTVQQLSVHTVGGVVTPAQPLMLIVPHDVPLEIEAFIENKDIGFVRPGQDAEVKIETFPYTKYGTLHARLESISLDAIEDEKRGLIYSSRVQIIGKSTINVEGAEVNLTPGMAVTVEIKTGKRRIIEYFLAPLLQHARESLRER